MKLCTFSKENDLVHLQYIEFNKESLEPTIAIIKENTFTFNMERILYSIESHFNVCVSESQKYFIEKNIRGVLNFQ